MVVCAHRYVEIRHTQLIMSSCRSLSGWIYGKLSCRFMNLNAADAVTALIICRGCLTKIRRSAPAVVRRCCIVASARLPFVSQAVAGMRPISRRMGTKSATSLTQPRPVMPSLPPTLRERKTRLLRRHHQRQRLRQHRPARRAAMTDFSHVRAWVVVCRCGTPTALLRSESHHWQELGTCV